jgi:hypothetical protein
MISIEPTREHPIPFDLGAEEPAVYKDRLAVAANTASLIEDLGGSIDMTEADAYAARELLKSSKEKGSSRALQTPGVAKKLSAILTEYDHQVIKDVQLARTFITNRLVELATCGDAKVEIKALELLGKHSDVGLFTERSEITITHRNSSDLENSIKERIKRLLHSDVVDVVPITDLDAHLGNPLDERREESNALMSQLDEPEESTND